MAGPETRFPLGIRYIRFFFNVEWEISWPFRSFASEGYISVMWWIIATSSIQRPDHLNGTTGYKFIVLMGHLCYVNLDLHYSASPSGSVSVGTLNIEA